MCKRTVNGAEPPLVNLPRFGKFTNAITKTLQTYYHTFHLRITKTLRWNYQWITRELHTHYHAITAVLPKAPCNFGIGEDRIRTRDQLRICAQSENWTHDSFAKSVRSGNRTWVMSQEVEKPWPEWESNPGPLRKWSPMRRSKRFLVNLPRHAL